MNNVIYVFARNLDWTKGGKMKWATVWTWMNPNCNWDDISWFKPTYIFSTVRWLCGLVVVQLSWLSGRALTAQILSWVFARYFSHENTVTQVSSFTLRICTLLFHRKIPWHKFHHLRYVFACYFFTWKYRDTSFIIYVMYLHVTFSHENTMTQVSSFTLWKFHLKNLTLHMNCIVFSWRVFW